jgi:hypothetical protein
MPTPIPVLNIPSTAAQPGNSSIAINKRLITLRLAGGVSFFILLSFKCLHTNTEIMMPRENEIYSVLILRNYYSK